MHVVGHELLRRMAHTATIHQASTTAMIRTPLQVFLARFTVIAALVFMAGNQTDTRTTPAADRFRGTEFMEYRAVITPA